MSAVNPLKFLGGLVLEIGAVIAALALLPALGNRDGQGTPVSLAPANFSPAQPNQVFFDARSSRVLDGAASPRSAPQAAWQSDFAAPPPVAQQRFVEDMLDHNSQRALDTATRLWTSGDRLLPPELRVPREAVRELNIEPVREPSRPVFPPQQDYSSQPNQSRPSHYAPAQSGVSNSRYDDRY